MVTYNIPEATLTYTAPAPTEKWKFTLPAGALAYAAPAPQYGLSFLVAPQAIDFDSGFAPIDVPTPMFISIAERSIYRAPASITVTADLCKPNTTATWRIDGVIVATDAVGIDGTSGPLSLTVPAVNKGTHLVSVEVAGAVAFKNISVLKDPRLPLIHPINDSAPILIPAAQVGDVYRWVLQDLMPGGLGSWVMPANPRNMSPLPRTATVQAAHTTSVAAGQFHLTEAAPGPVTWSFNGYCPDQAFYDQLKAYADLNRRFYLIDHRNRAWAVTIESLEVVPRKRQKLEDGSYNDWAGDYTVRAVIYDQNPKVPA